MGSLGRVSPSSGKQKDENRKKSGTSGDLPAFTIDAAEEPEDASALPGTGDPAQIRLALANALSASQPVIRSAHFSGRRPLLAELITAIEQQRAHIVLYGERGIGKTSLVHIFADTARQARYLVLYTSCGAEARFDEIFRNFMQDIPLLYHASISPTSDEAEHRRSFADLLDAAPLDPRTLAELLGKVVGTRVIMILDEYDRIASRTFRRDIAELIKNLSDRAARVQLVLVGVASNLDELVGFTPSIRRNIAGIAVGPMPEAEMLEILARAEAATGLSFAPEARSLILRMAAGSPYFVRLLAGRASGLALEDSRMEVTAADILKGTKNILAEWNMGLPRHIQAHLASPTLQNELPLLIAAAHVSGTPDSWFTALDIAAEQRGIPEGQVTATLEMLAEKTGLLETDEGSPTGGSDAIRRYRFRNQGLTQFLGLSAALARAGH